MATRSELLWEFLRKAVHLSSLLIVVVYTVLLNYFSDRVAILVMTAFLLVFLEIEHFRIEHRPNLMRFLDRIFRTKEENRMSSAPFMIISCIIAFSAFEYWVAFVALMMTVFGDLFAALFGKMFGKMKLLNEKTLVGTLAGFAANIMVGLSALPNFAFLILVMAVVATFVELVTNKLDDNLTVPMFAGFAGQMFVYFTGISLPPIDFTFLGLF
ncbi:MAG: phosphatidate cytidylyltransferase [Patescibacteria group bacterium]